MTQIYTDDLIYESDSKEWELRRYRKKNGTQGHAICIERYCYDEYSDTKKRMSEFFQCDERVAYLLFRKYLESVGFSVTKDDGNQ